MVKKGIGKISKGPRSTSGSSARNRINMNGLDSGMDANIGFASNLPEGLSGLGSGQGMHDSQGFPRLEQFQGQDNHQLDDEVPPGMPEMEPMEKLAQPIYGPDPTFRKEKIIKYVEAVEKFKKKEPAATYLKKIQELTDIMMHVYKLIRDENYSSEEEKNELSHRNSKIAEEKRDLEKKYKELMEGRFAEFRDDYKNIYELAVSEQGINRATLNHVLNTYSDYQKGKISHNAGTNIGLRYEKTRANLPDDFFTFLPE